MNNPVNYTDPSGNSWISSHWKSIVSSAVSISVSAIAIGAGGGIVFAGMAGGIAGGLTSSVLYGNNFETTLQSVCMGATMGGMSAGLSYAAASDQLAISVLQHAGMNALLAAAQGGDIAQGALLGGLSAWGSGLLNDYAGSLGRSGLIAGSALMGGALSSLTGGDFAQGAVTGAYGMIFNEMMHDIISVTEEDIMELFSYALDINKEYAGRSEEFYISLGGEIAEIVKSKKYNMTNACAAKLCEALRIKGIALPYIKGRTLKGDNGNYFLKASWMKNYLRSHINTKGISVGKNHKVIRYGIVFQEGFQGVSGHIDVVWNYKAAGTFFNRTLNGSLWNTMNTIVWKK
jgi:hypothetical protein